MSEQGWKDFLATDDLSDWVVLHGGAVAYYRVGTIGEAAHLAGAIAQIPELAGQHVLIGFSDTNVSVRITRDVWQLERRHISLARSISEVARKLHAKTDRSAVQEVQVAISAKAEMIDIGFWRAVLGYSEMAQDNAVDPLGHGSTVWMQEIAQQKTLRHAMHIDVSVAREHVQARLEAAIKAGGRIVDDSHAPSHWTLSDRAGNRVCICAWPDNSAKEHS